MVNFYNILNSVQPMELLRNVTEYLGALVDFIIDVFPLFSTLKLGMIQKLSRKLATVAEGNALEIHGHL